MGSLRSMKRPDIKRAASFPGQKIVEKVLREVHLISHLAEHDVDSWVLGGPPGSTLMGLCKKCQHYIHIEYGSDGNVYHHNIGMCR